MCKAYHTYDCLYKFLMAILLYKVPKLPLAMRLTCHCSPEKNESLQGECHIEEEKESVVPHAHTTSQPQAVVVKPIAASLTELTVLGAIWNHYLEGERGGREGGREGGEGGK